MSAMTKKQISLRRKIKRRKKRAEEFYRAAEKLKQSCTHNFSNSKGLWKCKVCDYIAGYTCPQSPSGTCVYPQENNMNEHMDIDWESCTYCGMPSERK